MRKIDWTKPLSEEDKVWLRQSGLPGVEDRIRENEEAHGEEPSTVDIPPDSVTRSALDPEARTSRTPSEAPPSGAPSEIQGIGGQSQDDVDDDYDSWKVGELEAEVANRNEDETNPDKIEVTGTGAGGKVIKPDYIAALRAWDRAHPAAA